MNTTTDQTTYQAAKEAAGYGPDDTPCEPRRSAYTDDEAGDAAFRRAAQRWLAFRNALVTARSDGASRQVWR